MAKSVEPTRESMGWEDSAKVEWKEKKEAEGKKNWSERWGPGNKWWFRYEKWIDTGINRLLRKPSRRALAWQAYEKWDDEETPEEGEVRTRKQDDSEGGQSKDQVRPKKEKPKPKSPMPQNGGNGEGPKAEAGESLKDVRNIMNDPLTHYQCKPGPYPLTTYGEIGWLGQCPSCQLEIYGNSYMKKPPLPWYMPKIATYLSNSQ